MVDWVASDVANDFEDFHPRLTDDFELADFESVRRFGFASRQLFGFWTTRLLNLDLKMVKDTSDNLRTKNELTQLHR